MRRVLAVLLLLSAFWQPFAIAGQATAFAEVEEVAHAVLHWQGEGHHHHEDGSVAQDDSGESMQHVIADGCLGAVVVWSTICFSFAPAQAARPSLAAEAAKPSPHLGGLRRPPRLIT